MSSSKSDGNPQWQEATRQALARLDILVEYGNLGLTFDRARPTGTGWVRSSNDVSLGVNIGSTKLRGRYKDFGKGNEKGGSLFDYAVKCGRFSSFVQAKIYYMQAAGLPVPGGKHVDVDERPVPSLTHEPKPTKPKKVHDYTQPMKLMFRHAWSNGDLIRLAEALKVGVFALEKMLVGTWDQNDKSFGIHWGTTLCTMWPEFHWTCKKLIPVAFMRRHWTPVEGTNGKQIIAGGVRGIYVPEGWIGRANRTGFLPVCEGGSDTAAATTCGLGALGYPESASEEVRHHLIPMVRAAIRTGRLRADIKIVVTRDLNKGGKLDPGAVSVSQWISDGLGLPVWLRHIPFGTGYFKDVREWLCHMLDNPHEVADGEADGLGRAFLDHIIGFPNVREPEKDAYRQKTTEVVSSSSVTTETRECLDCTPDHNPLLYTPPKTETLPTPIKDCGPGTESPLAPIKDCGPGLPPALAVPEVRLRATVEWDAAPITAIRASCLHRCPRGQHKVGTRRNGGTSGIGFRVSCCSWLCVGCGPRLRLEWSTLARRIFRGDVTAFAELFAWRGNQDSFRKSGRKRISEVDGNFIRCATTDGECLVITDTPITGAAPIAPIDADREFIAAVVAYVPPPTGKHQPIAKSDAWGVVRCGSGQFVIAGTFHGDDKAVDASYDTLERMGCIPGVTGKDGFRRCEWPENWSLDDRREAILWASIQAYPPGYVVGDSPIPSFCDAAEYLLDLPAESVEVKDLSDGGDITFKVKVVQPVVTPPTPPEPTPTLFDEPPY